MHTPLVLVILDGWGIAPAGPHNGITQARTPTYKKLLARYAHTSLEASGEAVGLPAGQMGNSEVGHTTIGAGTVLYQDLVRIGKDAASDSFIHNDAFAKAYAHVEENNSSLHVIGLLSTGGVHSHEDHLFEVIKSAKAHGVERIIVHPFLDGRDSPKTSGTKSLERLESLVSSIGGCSIGSVTGRYYAMDRDTNWDRTQKAFDAIFNGKADHIYETSVKPSQIITEWYHKDIFDEHMEPMVFQKDDGTVLEVHDNDAIIFTNFRSDRAKQISQLIFDHAKDKNLLYVTMTEYGKEYGALVAYSPEVILSTMASAIAAAGLKQVHIAETEKYPHVTYFVNGGKKEPHDGEEHVLVPSRKDVKTHDEAPEMRAKEICDEALKRLPTSDFIFLNFANPDMVGHTAKPEAIKIAIETVDRELGRLVEATLALNGSLLIIADHGNAEVMVDPVTGEPHTSHTTNPVPCIYVHKDKRPNLRSGGGLKDIAPTVLSVLQIPIPESMTGKSLL